MNKLKFIIFLCCFFAISTAKKSEFRFANKKYDWVGINEIQTNLIMQGSTDIPRRTSNYILFRDKYFTDVRTASCGNDIFYEKKGYYTVKGDKLTLVYTGGKFTDNVGGDSMQVYVKGKVNYTIVKKSKDTVTLEWKSGYSSKNILRTK